MKLLVDMNLSPRWITLLDAAGFQAVHWSLVGRRNARDFEIMAFARADDYVVLTHDLDFSSILAATDGEKPSVVQIRAEDVNPDTIGFQVITALQQMESELKEGALLTIDPGSHTHAPVTSAIEEMTAPLDGYRSPISIQHVENRIPFIKKRTPALTETMINDSIFMHSLDRIPPRTPVTF